MAIGTAGSVVLGDIDRIDLLKDAEDKDNLSLTR